MKLGRVCLQRAQRGSILLNTTTTRLLARPPTLSIARRHYAAEAQAHPQNALGEIYPKVEKTSIYEGISQKSFPAEVATILMAPLDHKDIEIKPDGLIYLPEIRYRRILNRAFGPGGWGLLPIGPPIIERGNIIRTYALYCHGRFVSEATGEQPYFEGVSSTATATEAAKSNALIRCCKDLGVGSELWDPQFIFDWKRKYSVEVQCENLRSKDKKRLWRRADRPPFEWPWKEIRSMNQPAPQPKMALETGADPFAALEDSSSAPILEEAEFTPAPQQQQRQYQQPAQQQQQPPQQRQYQKPAAPPARQQAPPQAAPAPPPTPSAPVPPTAPAATPTPSTAVEKGKGKKAAAAPQPAAAAEPATAELGWDLDAKLPTSFKTHAGKTWRDMLGDTKAFRYIRWAAINLVGVPQQQAIGFIAFVEQIGGEKAALAKFGPK